VSGLLAGSLSGRSHTELFPQSVHVFARDRYALCIARCSPLKDLVLRLLGETGHPILEFEKKRVPFA
jgi:hypothetical protein